MAQVSSIPTLMATPARKQEEIAEVHSDVNRLLWVDMAEEEEVALTANGKIKTLDVRLSWSKIVGNIQRMKERT